MELVKHIKAINEKSKKKMDANPNLWIGMLVEDPKHWAEYGVTTVAEFNRYQDESFLYDVVSSDYSKSYARSIGIFTMSDEELAKAIDRYTTDRVA